MRQSARMTGSKNSAHRASQAKAAFGRSFCLAVPELTRSTGIQLNARLSLRRPCELLTLSQSCGLADAASSGHAYRAIRGRCCVIEGSGPAHFARSIHYLSRGKRCVPKLKVRKPCNERGLQKLDMPDGHSQFVQSPLPFCDLGTEQILIMIVLRTARQILIGIIAQGYCGSR